MATRDYTADGAEITPRPRTLTGATVPPGEKRKIGPMIDKLASLPHEAADKRRCCRTLSSKDSHRESMRLDGVHEQA